MWLLVVAGAAAVFIYFLLKVVQLCRADADLTVLGSKMKPQYFEGKVVWVTGASSGIGEEMCYQLSKMGAKLILSARNEQKLKQVKSSLANPGDAKVLPVDLSNPEDSRASTSKALECFGKVDILVNNAGVSTRALFVDIQEHVHRRVMEIDFFAPWILTHGVIDGMVRGGFGHVINISSIWGKCAPSNRSAYSSAKFGIIGLMDAVRYEMLESNVHVTNVMPGPVVTGAAFNALTADGTKYGVTDKLVACGMTVTRCVELILVGVSNQQREDFEFFHFLVSLHPSGSGYPLPVKHEQLLSSITVLYSQIWVSKQWWLMLPYLAHYCPSLLHYFLSKRARRELEAAKKAH